MADIERKASHSSISGEKDGEFYDDEVIAGSRAENAGGAPVEVVSPLGRQVGAVTVIALNISMMIGTGICKPLFCLVSIVCMGILMVSLHSCHTRIHSQSAYTPPLAFSCLANAPIRRTTVPWLSGCIFNDMAYWSRSYLFWSFRLQRICSVVSEPIRLGSRLPRTSIPSPQVFLPGDICGDYSAFVILG